MSDEGKMVKLDAATVEALMYVAGAYGMKPGDTVAKLIHAEAGRLVALDELTRHDQALGLYGDEPAAFPAFPECLDMDCVKSGRHRGDCINIAGKII